MKVLTGNLAGLFDYPAQWKLARPQRLAKSRFREKIAGSSAPKRGARTFLAEQVESVYLTHALIGSATEGQAAVVVIRVQLKQGGQFDIESLTLLDGAIPYQCILEVVYSTVCSIVEASHASAAPTLLGFTLAGSKKLEKDASGSWRLRGRVQTYYRSQEAALDAERPKLNAESTPSQFFEAVLKELMPAELPANQLTVAEVEQNLKAKDQLLTAVKKLQAQHRREKQPARKMELAQRMRQLKAEIDSLPLR